MLDVLERDILEEFERKVELDKKSGGFMEFLSHKKFSQFCQMVKIA